MVDPLSDMINRVDRMKKLLELVRDARDDLRKTIKVVDELNKNTEMLISVGKDLASIGKEFNRTIKDLDYTVRRLISLMEKFDKNFDNLMSLADLASSILGDKDERKTK